MSGNGFSFVRPPKPNFDASQDSNPSSESDGGEDGNLAQQRSRVKASTSHFSEFKDKNASSYVSAAVHRAGSSASTRSAVTGGGVTAPVKSSVKESPPRNTAIHAPRHLQAPSLRVKLVLIEDYAFSVSSIDMVVGQWIEFRLSKDVPAHAEHEICGVSPVKQLCFESPLLQVSFKSLFVYFIVSPLDLNGLFCYLSCVNNSKGSKPLIFSPPPLPERSPCPARYIRK